MKLISWNVNGLRANLKKGFLDFLRSEDADIVCLQETRAHPEDITIEWPGYEAHWNWAQKKGYSGVLTLSRAPALSVSKGIGVPLHDTEGRVVTTEFAQFFLVNVYVPNAQRELTRLAYRQLWDAAFLRYLLELERHKPVIFCGDLNVAHREIDLARPKTNARTHGFTPEERAGFEAVVSAGFVDTFRHFEPGPGHYTWWSQMNQARVRNIGWRIDYFVCSAAARAWLSAARIYPHIMGSDHCPIGLELQLPPPDSSPAPAQTRRPAGRKPREVTDQKRSERVAMGKNS